MTETAPSEKPKSSDTDESDASSATERSNLANLKPLGKGRALTLMRAREEALRKAAEEGRDPPEDIPPPLKTKAQAQTQTEDTPPPVKTEAQAQTQTEDVPPPVKTKAQAQPQTEDIPPPVETKAQAQTQTEDTPGHLDHAAERQRLLDRMSELKNDKLRHEIETLEAEAKAKAKAEAEAEAREQAQTSGDSAQPAPEHAKALPPVRRARLRLRHITGFLTFVLMVLVPIVASAWYLWTRAHDRYVSYAGFSVRTEEIGSAFELLGGVAELSGSSSSDTDILYKFIQSPELVAAVNAQVDLRALWGRPGQDWTDPNADPVYSYNPAGAFATLFSLGLNRGLSEAGVDPENPALGGLARVPDMDHPQGAIEDLTAHWNRMVSVFSDSGTGLIDLEVQAFSAAEAQMVAQLIYDESSEMINRLSAIARADATGYARTELEQTQARLAEARQNMVAFRLQTGIVDPSVSIQEQQGLLVPLQSQLAQALIDLDLKRQTNPSDPRIPEDERRVEVIRSRIDAERAAQGLTSDSATPAENSFAVQLAEYERLAVELEFAQQAYTLSQGAFDKAVAEAQRQSRYLAAHVNPTLPESPTQPDRWSVLSKIALFAFLGWSIMVLAAYALRDRR